MNDKSANEPGFDKLVNAVDKMIAEQDRVWNAAIEAAAQKAELTEVDYTSESHIRLADKIRKLKK